MKRTLATVLMAGTFAVAAHGAATRAPQDATRTTWSGVYTEDQAKRGEAVYAKACASCHGPELDGVDQASPLAGKDFAAGWDTLSLSDLFTRIKVSMPADKPGSLTPEEVAQTIAFILRKNGFPAGASELGTQADTLKSITYVATKP